MVNVQNLCGNVAEMEAVVMSDDAELIDLFSPADSCRENGKEEVYDAIIAKFEQTLARVDQYFESTAYLLERWKQERREKEVYVDSYLNEDD